MALVAARALIDRMRTLYRELERRTGAPIAVHRALACIAQQPGMTASALATTLGMQRPAVSHLLRELTLRGWVARTRSATDQRSVRLTIAPAGRAILEATSGRVVGTLQRAVGELQLGALTDLANGLQALMACLPEPEPQDLPPRRRVRRGLARN